MAEYNDLCWYLVGTIRCFDPFSFNSLRPLKTFGRHSGPNIFQLYFVGHSVHVPRASISFPRASMSVPRGVPGLSTFHLLLKNPGKKSGVVTSANLYQDSRHWTQKAENGRCGLLVALCWRYYNLWSPVRGRYEPIPAIVFEHTSNMARWYWQNTLYRLPIPGIS